MNDSTTLQKALITIKKLKHLLQEQKNKLPEPIAIIGLSCRFPQAKDKHEYWNLLSQGKNTITSLPEQRWHLLKDTHEFTQREKNYSYYGSYLENITDFDSYFFGISPREALRMDPQQRILLEVAHEAILDANLTTKSLAGSNTGVFVSLYASQFAHLQQLDNDMDALFLPTGNAQSIAANRLSYFYDLHGPSIVLDTACSSSLIALHLACLNLQTYACDMALVGAVNINLLPSINLILSKAKMLSPSGQCKTFDANADGYVPGEGAGIIILKPLSKAIKDGNQIYAVIAGSAINQDGKTNGLTAPNGLQQEKLLKSAYQAANILPEKISYIECHGTGTFLGDPIEIQALGEIIGKNRNADTPCWIGSVKTNIGHLEPAAGIASIIKVALALQHKKIPPHLNFSTPNPHIAFNRYHLCIPEKLLDWPQYDSLRIGGVSGFGFGGSNAHIVIRELTQDEKSMTIPPIQMNISTHQWQRKTYWFAINAIPEYNNSHPLRGNHIESPLPILQFKFMFDTKKIPEVQDTFHVVHAGYYLEMITFAMQKIHSTEQFVIEDIEFLSPLLVPHSTVVDVQLILNKLTNEHYSFTVFSHSNNQNKWIEHAKGHIKFHIEMKLPLNSFALKYDNTAHADSGDNLYLRIDNMGMPTGDTIRWTTQFWRKENSILCEFRNPKTIENSENFALKLHPGIIDACVQPVFLLLSENVTKPYVAMSMKKIKYLGHRGSPMYSLTHLKEIKGNDEKVIADWCLFDENHHIIAVCEDLCMAQLNNTMKINKITQINSQCHFREFSDLNEQKHHIIQYLIEQFSLIFAMPKEDINIQISLQQLGMDSLMALAVMRVIESGLGVSFSIQEVMQDISIEKIANLITATTHKEKSAKISHTEWIAYRNKLATPKKRLFCFPYGGAGASVYRDWQKNFPDFIEVCPIQLPGRENRLDEAPFSDIDSLLHQLLEVLQPELNLPFAFFGHSFGALIAFELTRRLHLQNLPQPMHLFPSAFPDPRLPSKSLDNLLKQLKTFDIELRHLSHSDSIDKLSAQQLQNISSIFHENGVVEYRENLMSKDIMKILLPIFVGDMEIVKSYQYRETQPLNVPFTVFLGKRDTWVLKEDHLGWSELTQNSFNIHEVDSGHLFIKESDLRKEIANKIADAMMF